ncbi:MAG: histidine phosphatase family protein [Leucobacter sp.]|nr:histidine phosphatase family protein [Leucobacter sp.]
MTAGTPLLALVRHGETDWNRARRIQGRTEVPLNTTGRSQALAAARLLSSSTPVAWNSVHASPLGRAIETAEIIADHLALNSPGIHDGLWERNFGEAEGLLVTDSEARWPGLREVPDAERIEDVAQRSADAIRELAHTSPGSVAVAHGAMLRAGLELLTGSDIPRILNGEIWLLRHAGTGYSVTQLK